jgi:lysophospholipase L1-like esterase
MKKILAIGDCNMLGVGELQGAAYPERVADMLGMSLQNNAYTMSTTREGLQLLQDNLSSEHENVFIQFGLVDSYFTFKYSPYILYYPDTFFRKQLRSIVKKYKKICRNCGLNKKLGEINVVAPDEYQENLSRMVRLCGERAVILLETLPHYEERRNPAIQQYNTLLKQVAATASNCHVIELYDDFAANMEKFYVDATHANAEGYAFIASRVVDTMKRLENS